MNLCKPHNRFLALALALILFGCLASQASASFFSIESMGCDAQVMCSACSYIVGSIGSNLTFFYAESECCSNILSLAPDIYQKPLYHPPR